MSFLSYLTKLFQEQAGLSGTGKDMSRDPLPEPTDDDQEAEMVRKHIIAHGRVQGVGFRYICTGIASECHVTGWIQNNYDGTVEMEVQGADHRVDRFLMELNADAPGGNRWVRIDRLEIEDIPLVYGTEETSFRARHY